MQIRKKERGRLARSWITLDELDRAGSLSDDKSLGVEINGVFRGGHTHVCGTHHHIVGASTRVEGL